MPIFIEARIRSLKGVVLLGKTIKSLLQIRGWILGLYNPLDKQILAKGVSETGRATTEQQEGRETLATVQALGASLQLVVMSSR